MDEEEKFDLIEFPILPELLGGIELYKSDDTYITSIEDLNIIKKLFATKKLDTIGILLEIEDDHVKILGIAKNHYVFETPIDFVFPVDEKVSHFYQKVSQIIDHGTTEEVVNLSALLNKETLPFYPLPILISHDQNNINVLKTKKKELKPGKKVVAPEIDNAAEEFLLNLFKIHPILRAEFIKNEFNNKINNKFTYNRVKILLNKCAFFVNNGPFAKCWVNNDIDVTNNPNFFIYQVFGKTKVHEKFFQLFERPSLVEKVERNRDLYFSGDYSEKYGYLTKLAIIDLEKKIEAEDLYQIYD
ncbi:hypothetical protein H312_01446 [Anncaliia algerae PRA339]|uniref:Transcription factor IIIC subunit 5 HTH domain-containing protein n=1 Tax=Anncaliia algerae PRA339 TaxID=1288291 RepID=A0A059F2E2_9MICR|nr:hypothetical protein H312_01446 [Anncaliia algerae PRA339]